MKALYVSRLQLISWFIVWTLGWSLYLIPGPTVHGSVFFAMSGAILGSSGLVLKTRGEWSRRLTAKDLIGIIIALLIFVALIAALNHWATGSWLERFMRHPLTVASMWAAGVYVVYRWWLLPKTQGTGPNLVKVS
jgi:cytochrome bd-type quinol oxidase subunit 2